MSLQRRIEQLEQDLEPDPWRGLTPGDWHCLLMSVMLDRPELLDRPEIPHRLYTYVIDLLTWQSAGALVVMRHPLACSLLTDPEQRVMTASLHDLPEPTVFCQVPEVQQWRAEMLEAGQAAFAELSETERGVVQRYREIFRQVDSDELTIEDAVGELQELTETL